MDRRDFIKKMSRSMIAGGMLAGSAYLLLKPETGEACNLDFICKDCRQLKSCTIPEAEAYKKESETKIDS